VPKGVGKRTKSTKGKLLKEMQAAFAVTFLYPTRAEIEFNQHTKKLQQKLQKYILTGMPGQKKLIPIFRKPNLLQYKKVEKFYLQIIS
jgi:hypothetical protein